MGIKVSFTTTTVRGDLRQRRTWYVWRRRSTGWCKERLASYIKRMQAQGLHENVARAMAAAVAKGYRLKA